MNPDLKKAVICGSFGIGILILWNLGLKLTEGTALIVSVEMADIVKMLDMLSVMVPVAGGFLVIVTGLSLLKIWADKGFKKYRERTEEKREKLDREWVEEQEERKEASEKFMACSKGKGFFGVFVGGLAMTTAWHSMHVVAYNEVSPTLFGVSAVLFNYFALFVGFVVMVMSFHLLAERRSG